MSTRLSENFTLEELTVTSTGLPNVPNAEEIVKLAWLAQNILQPIRNALGPIIVDSAFRSKVVNKAVGGVPNSQHELAEAADIQSLHFTLDAVFVWIRHNVKFGQLIIEQKKRADGSVAHWIHVSRERTGKPNGMCLAYHNGVYTNVA